MSGKIIFIGNIVSDKICEENKACSPAGNKWQTNFIKSLENVSGKEVINLSILPLQVWPIGKKRKIDCFIKKNEAKSILLSYINIIGLKKISIFFAIIINLLKYSKNEDDKIIIYNLYTPILIAILLMKKKMKIQLIGVVADLVYTQDLNYTGIKKIIYLAEVKLQKYGLKKMDKVIAVNKLILEDFEIKNGMVLEGGIISNENVEGNNKIFENKKKIIFTGTLDNLNGIEFLLETFKKIGNDIELEIYGRGPLETKVIDISKSVKNIKYKGFISQDEIMKVLKSADLLILPRVKTIKTLRYTFPSKLFEYMMSGIPVIMTKIPGLDEKYIKNTYVCDTIDSNEFAKFIIEKSNLSSEELLKKGILAKNFIMQEKKWDFQLQEVWNFINETTSKLCKK